MDTTRMQLTVAGGATGPTGSHFLLSIAGHTLAVDCGLHQGTEEVEAKNREAFSFDPAHIEALFVTHAHLDHIGRIPLLYQGGFRGTIHSTEPTRELAMLMFTDGLKLQQYAGYTGPRYSEADIDGMRERWQVHAYHEEVPFHDATILFSNAGHILGSAIVEVYAYGTGIAFSGDLGNSPSPLLPDTEHYGDVSYIVTESVYGDRTHEDREQRRVMVREALERTQREQGTLIIPAFSIERTQELLYEMNDLIESGTVPPLPVFLDSPLAIRVTELYARYVEFFKTDVRERVRSGDDIFSFPLLRFTRSHYESHAIEAIEGPKVIIAGSGMSDGGRIRYHEQEYLGDPRNTLLIVGFQAAGTLGRQLQEGVQTVEIDGKRVTVRADVRVIRGYSAHKDGEGLFTMIERAAERGRLKKVFVVLGETHAAAHLAQRINDQLGISAVVPHEGEVYELERIDK